jgi:maltooligosyltrehalose trehalohydrolase
LRRDDPVIRGHIRLDGAVLGPEAFVLRFFSPGGAHDRLLFVNLGRELYLQPAPEPLLAPVASRGWETLWSSDAPGYGGPGTADLETTSNWILPGHAAVLLRPGHDPAPPHARLTEKT